MQTDKPPAHSIDMRAVLILALQQASQPKKKGKERKKQGKERKKRSEEQNHNSETNKNQAEPQEDKRALEESEQDKQVEQVKPREENGPAERERLAEQTKPTEEDKQAEQVKPVEEEKVVKPVEEEKVDKPVEEEKVVEQENQNEQEEHTEQENTVQREKPVELKLFLPRFSCIHGSDMNCEQCKARETNIQPPADPKNDRIVFVVPSELDPILGKATVCQRAVFHNSSSPGYYLQLPTELYKVEPVTQADHVKRGENGGTRESHFFLRLGTSYFKATPVPWDDDDDDDDDDDTLNNTDTSVEQPVQQDPQNQQGNKRSRPNELSDGSSTDTQNNTSIKRQCRGRDVSRSESAANGREGTNRCEPTRIGDPLYVNINDKRFRVMDVLGYGASSVMCRGLEMKERKMYAIKCVLLSDAMETAEALRNEVDILKHLRSCPRAVTMFDYQEFLSVKSLFIQLEMGDVDLSRLMQSVDDLNMHDILYFWDEMLTAVNEVHKYGVIHGDLKPSNFVFFHGILKVTDFGLSYKTILPWEKIHRKRSLAAVNYMSPETARHQVTSFKSDVWSLGCILYHLLYKVTPFEHFDDYSDKISAISNQEVSIQYPYRVDCPRSLIDILRQCLTRDEAARPSVEEIINFPWQ